MTANTFLKEFRHLADAPDGIKKLRELILQLAVRGKLVPQDPRDEPAGKLLKKITAEKAKLVKEGKIKPQKPLPPISKDDAPYELPDGWEWVRLREISCDCGQTVPKERFTYVDVGSIDKERGIISEEVQVLDPAKAPSRARKLVTVNSVIYSTVRPYLLNIAVVDKTMDPSPIVSTAFFVIDLFGQISSRFLYHYLRSHPFIEYVNTSMTGMAYPAVNDTKMALGPTPLPPLAEQRRIVAKVDQLMKLCDELEEKQQEREKTRLAMNKSCLNALTSPDPCSSRPQPPTPPQQDVSAPTTRRTRPPEWAKHFRKISDNFHLLYDTPETVAELRKSILQLAVMGRLVPQYPTDEPASKLVKHAISENEKLVKARQRRKSRPLPPIHTNDLPFDSPIGWTWVRLGVLGHTNIGLTYSPRDAGESGTPVLRANNIRDGSINLSDLVRVSSEIPDRAIVKTGDLLICARSGSQALVGKSALLSELPEIMAFGAFMAIFRSPYNPFIQIYLRSPVFRHVLESVSTTTINQITQGNLKQALICLPPLAEQKRIVAKVDQLMKLCDELETKLKQSRTDANSLIAALVNHLTEAA